MNPNLRKTNTLLCITLEVYQELSNKCKNKQKIGKTIAHKSFKAFDSESNFNDNTVGMSLTVTKIWANRIWIREIKTEETVKINNRQLCDLCRIAVNAVLKERAHRI